MTAPQPQAVRAAVAAAYRDEWGQVVATLIGYTGDWDLAEDCAQEAFAAALTTWPRDGVPSRPGAWLTTTARNRATDRLRRDTAAAAKLRQLAVLARDPLEPPTDSIPDERLRLIFTCCHPALPADGRVALTLREVCDLTTEEIARAFLAPPSTIAQRIVRAKAKIRDARLPYRVPERAELPARLESVLRVIYLVFNEGYLASAGASLTRADLCAEAIRLGRLLYELLPDVEVAGLLALMLLHDARRAARTDACGELVRLDEQDRSLWDRQQIAEGALLVQRALSTRAFGPYALQAAIVAVHAEAPSAAQTDWPQIVRLYDVLLQLSPSSVVELNRAVAVAMRDGPEAGLLLVDELLGHGDLQDYHLSHATRADLLRRLARIDEAREAYSSALRFVQLEPERRFLQRQLDELGD